MTSTTQDAQVFVSKDGVGYELFITTDGVISRKALVIYQPGPMGRADRLSDSEMEAIAIAAANALAHIKRG